MIVPRITVSYNDSIDPEDAGIPVCTLRLFPN
jgi:hypothetical protein